MLNQAVGSFPTGLFAAGRRGSTTGYRPAGRGGCKAVFFFVPLLCFYGFIDKKRHFIGKIAWFVKKNSVMETTFESTNRYLALLGKNDLDTQGLPWV